MNRIVYSHSGQTSASDKHVLSTPQLERGLTTLHCLRDSRSHSLGLDCAVHVNANSRRLCAATFTRLCAAWCQSHDFIGVAIHNKIWIVGSKYKLAPSLRRLHQANDLHDNLVIEILLGLIDN